jgi:XTP/dITP diphosphohydrolase
MLEAMGPEGMAAAAQAAVQAADRVAAATARCAASYFDGLGDDGTEVVAEGSEEGTLVLPGRGENGFGWDPVFLPEAGDRTYGELPPEEKDRNGHRGRAWRELARKLRGTP